MYSLEPLFPSMSPVSPVFYTEKAVLVIACDTWFAHECLKDVSQELFRTYY